MEIVNNLFGLETERLTVYQMGARTVVVFITSLFFVRVAGIRTFGKKTTFDQITSLILGTLMGNAIFTAKAPFFPLLFASLLFMLLHRFFAWLTFLSSKLGKIIKGAPIPLIKDGVLNKKNMQKTLITREDIEESMRLDGEQPDLEKIKASYIERSGNISFIKKV